MTRKEYITAQCTRTEIPYDQYVMEMEYSFVIYNYISRECRSSQYGNIYVYGSYQEAIDDCYDSVHHSGDIVLREDIYVNQYLTD